jgi:hypothetical protein
MEEKIKNTENENVTEKLAWESPKLFCLDKGKTEGGYTAGTPEDTTMDTGS